MRDWAIVEPYLQRIARLDDITEEHLVNLRASSGTGNQESAATSLTDVALDSWRRFRTGAPLSQDDKHRLEAIVLPNGLRPVFDIQDDSFSDLPEPWQELNVHRAFLERSIRGIGRINVPGHATLQYAGTGFVVGDGLLLTNRHVAELFCQTGDTQLTFMPGISPTWDPRQEVTGSASIVINLIAPVLVMAEWDAALLRTSALPLRVLPLTLAREAPDVSDSQVAAIVGYPALDTRGGIEEILQQIQIFRAIFDKKRLQPGRLMGMRQAVSFGKNVNALAHDCSTLGGNSGSALIDVVAEKILGLHFGGDYLVANYAVPSWQLAKSDRLRDEGVLFA
jgi:endonuclease G, mitochondrial